MRAARFEPAPRCAAESAGFRPFGFRFKASTAITLPRIRTTTIGPAQRSRTSTPLFIQLRFAARPTP